jgi:Cu(I)/Ag(I) efflux system membrane fusion protein
MAEEEPMRGVAAALGTGLRIAFVRLRFVLLLLAILVVAASWNAIEARVGRVLHGAAGAARASADEYFCPMHPAVVRDEPGKCPSCGMPLSARKRSIAPVDAAGPPRLQLSPFRIRQAGIRTSVVERRPLELSIDAPGFVRYDEARVARVTARFSGRIERLEANTTGASIEKGKALATIYSKEVTAAFTTYLVQLKELRESEARSATGGITRGRALVDAARRQFALWGFESDQIEEIEKEGKAPTTVEIRAPLSGVVTHREVVVGDYVVEGTPLFHVADLSVVWLVAKVHRDDLPFVAKGRKLVGTDAGVPGRTFEGEVAYVAPFLDETTQTADVRAEVSNPDGLLRPGVSVAASLRVPVSAIERFRAQPRSMTAAAPRVVYTCPMHPDVVQDAPGKCEKCGGMDLVRKEIPAAADASDVLAVPESAVVDAGDGKVVYVESSPGVFAARAVEVGPRCGEFVPVVGGVEVGEKVAVAGAFLLDAETRLDPGAARAYFGASDAPAAKPGSAR